MVIVCGYAMECFDDESGAEPLRAICSHHTHVFPTEQISEAPDERARLERVTLLEQRARALDRGRVGESRPEPAAPPMPAMLTVYVIDDDPSIRRALGRLLASLNIPAQTFDSAEAFLSEVDQSSSGCLIVDVQLLGMSGLELQRHLGTARDRWPIIAMSGAFDAKVEQHALRHGAVTFLRKPFVAETLLEAIAKAR
jgi:CheY-like chemotaxis protein